MRILIPFVIPGMDGDERLPLDNEVTDLHVDFQTNR
jgi:hypothetical protein